MISSELLVELKQILEEDYGLKLTMQQVTEIASTLVGFVETSLKIEARR